MWNIIFNSKYSSFLYAIFSKWQIIVVSGSLVVTFWVFTGLTKIGLIDNVTNVLIETMSESKTIAKNCTPQIVKLSEFWKCLQNPGDYHIEESEESEQYESSFKEKLNLKNNQLSNEENDKIINPYESD
jgi:hypothetical protein